MSQGKLYIGCSCSDADALHSVATRLEGPKSTSVLARYASNLAGPAISASFTPAHPPPSSLNTRLAFPPSYRPNKHELEACLSNAHVRARNRRLLNGLGHGLPSNAKPHTNHANSTYSPRVTATPPTTPITPRTGTWPSIPYPPLYPSAMPSPHAHSDRVMLDDIMQAPSPSTLPPPPDFSSKPDSRPQFPHRRSRVHVSRLRTARATTGLGLGLPLDVPEEGEDAILTPTHTFSDTFRRTPGAPINREARKASVGESYFHLPSNLFTATGPIVGKSRAAIASGVGLGLMVVDYEVEGDMEEVEL